MNEDARNLWQSQKMEGFKMTAEEIHWGVERLDRKARRRNNAGYVVCLLVVAGAVWWLTLFHNPLQQIGSVLTIAGVGYMIWQLRSNARGEALARGGAGTLGATYSLEFHRSQLARQRDFHRGRRFWLRMLTFVPGPVLFLFGFARAHPEIAGSIRLNAIAFGALAFIAVPLNLWLASRYQRQIDEIDGFERDK
jgi:hypothetical protein